jgi:hypothetical protein
MRKLNRFLSLLMLACILLWWLPGISFGQGQCDAGPTITETVTEDESWVECELPDPCDCEFPLLIVSPSSAEAQITPGDPLPIIVCGGVPPFSWEVTGDNGWTLDYDDTDTSYNILRLSYGPECSVHGPTGTVTVSDSCGELDSIEVKNLQGGYTLLETCGAMDGWHQTWCEEGGYDYLVDHYYCGNPQEGDHGDPCPDHPCCGCSSYYCAEGSQKWGWGCP